VCPTHDAAAEPHRHRAQSHIVAAAPARESIDRTGVPAYTVSGGVLSPIVSPRVARGSHDVVREKGKREGNRRGSKDELVAAGRLINSPSNLDAMNFAYVEQHTSGTSWSATSQDLSPVDRRSRTMSPTASSPTYNLFDTGEF
jgi:hypothetical protein